METSLSIEIDRPIEEVFEAANEHIPEWSIICVEDQVLEEQPGGVGTTFRFVTEERSRRMEFQGVVTEFEPPRRAAVELTGAQFDLEVDTTCEDLSGRTRFTQHSLIKPKGFFKVVFALLGWAFKKSGCKAQLNELESLKRFCEQRAG